jgi:hypothetical protein
MWSVYSLSTQTSIALNFGSPEAPQDFGSAQYERRPIFFVSLRVDFGDRT